MKMYYLTLVITAALGFTLIGLLTSEMKWGAITALTIVVAGNKWIRRKRHAEKDEIEYDERVYDKMKQLSVQVFSFSNLFLLLYLVISELVFEGGSIQPTYLILYISATLMIVFYIVPFIARKT